VSTGNVNKSATFTCFVSLKNIHCGSAVSRLGINVLTYWETWCNNINISGGNYEVKSENDDDDYDNDDNNNT
jgi:hypothetical protein